jgi:hypothetical protein
MVMRWLLCLVISFSLFGLAAQDVGETITEDSIKVHSPKKASRLSMFLPGAGQVYNSMAMPKGKKHAWWKIPIIYAGLGATAYFFTENQILQRNYKQEYINRVDFGMAPGAEFPEFQTFDNTALIQLHEAHKSSRNTMAIGFIAVYGLNILDALVEAHFIDFDVSEDLSLGIRPAYLQNNGFGLSLALHIK